MSLGSSMYGMIGDFPCLQIFQRMSHLSWRICLRWQWHSKLSTLKRRMSPPIELRIVNLWLFGHLWLSLFHIWKLRWWTWEGDPRGSFQGRLTPPQSGLKTSQKSEFKLMDHLLRGSWKTWKYMKNGCFFCAFCVSAAVRGQNVHSFPIEIHMLHGVLIAKCGLPFTCEWAQVPLWKFFCWDGGLWFCQLSVQFVGVQHEQIFSLDIYLRDNMNSFIKFHGRVLSIAGKWRYVLI